MTVVLRPGHGVDPEDSHPRPTSQHLVLRQTLNGLLAWCGGTALLGPIAASRGEEPGETGLIVRNTHPLDLETPVSELDTWLTPNRLFFVRSHLGEPGVGDGPWRLEIGGLVDRPATLGLDDLKGLEPVTVPAVLQCSGNSQAFHQSDRPRCPLGARRGRSRGMDGRPAGGLARTGQSATGCRATSTCWEPTHRRRRPRSISGASRSRRPGCADPGGDRDERRAAPPAPRRPDPASTSSPDGPGITG